MILMYSGMVLPTVSCKRETLGLSQLTIKKEAEEMKVESPMDSQAHTAHGYEGKKVCDVCFVNYSPCCGGFKLCSSM